MCKSLQVVIGTSACKLDPQLTKVRNMTNAIYFLTQSVPFIRVLHSHSQIVYGHNITAKSTLS